MLPPDSPAVLIAPVPPVPATGSRRKRLWELAEHAHCPVIGVCLPIAALRRVVDKVAACRAFTDAYRLHCAAVTESKTRNPLSEALHKELDRRCALSLQHAAKLKHTAALAEWWDASSAGKGLPGALWATLTHPRCTAALEHDVLGAVHMLQHQLGMATRVELERFEALIDENAVLARELGGAQLRTTRQAADFARRTAAFESELMRVRARLLGRETELAQQRERLAMLEAAAPDLCPRLELTQRASAQAERIQALQRELMQARQEAERQRCRAEVAEQVAAAQHANAAPASSPGETLPRVALQDRAVLCVGGRAASVPVYRQVVERTGGRFLHHDGGDEDHAGRLDATLTAADLVICQTGCISHGAYWRVKDHCKRTGKRCVFVEAPSRTALERALDALSVPPSQAVAEYDR